MPVMNEKAMMAAMQQGMAGGMGMPQEPTPSPNMMAQQPPEAEEGRGGDSIIAHLTPGEVVVPAEILRIPKNAKAIESIFKTADVPIEMYTVGHESNSMNPETGYPEFAWKFYKKLENSIKKITGLTKMKKFYEKKGIEAGEAAAESEGIRIQAEIQAYQRAVEARVKDEAKKAAENLEKVRAQSIVTTSKFRDALSTQKKMTSSLGTNPGDAISGGSSAKDLTNAIVKRRKRARSAVKQSSRPS